MISSASYNSFDALTRQMARGYMATMALPLVPILLTAAVCTLTGYVFLHWLARMQTDEVTLDDGATADSVVERLLLCPICGVHVVAAVARRCDRPGCAAGR